MDVLWSKVHHQTLLLHLAEVEQLVDQFKQTMGVAVDDLHVIGGMLLFHELLQRSDNQRYRGAYLMGNHRKEVQTCFAHLLLLLFVQPLQLYLMVALGPF